MWNVFYQIHRLCRSNINPVYGEKCLFSIVTADRSLFLSDTMTQPVSTTRLVWLLKFNYDYQIRGEEVVNNVKYLEATLYAFVNMNFIVGFSHFGGRVKLTSANSGFLLRKSW